MSHPNSTNQSYSGRSTPQPPPPGLPNRPPPSAVSNNAAFAAFKPRAVATPPARPATHSPAPGAYNYPASTYGMSYPQQSAAPATQSYYPGATSAYPTAPAGQAYYGGAAAAYPGYSGTAAEYGQTPPQIKNPFAPPPTRSTGGSLYGNSFDPEYEAQIQQWQSAYAPKDESNSKANLGKSGKGEGAASAGGANAIPLSGASSRTQAAAPTTAQAVPVEPPVNPVDKDKTVVRSGGGQKWEDPTLLEWGNHPRLFIGNLAGEVTDESLLKAFAKYPSVQKARVVRDKRTTKSKGYGFVSLANTDEFFQAAKEMNGKYIGSHPVLIKRAEAEIKPVVKKDDRHGRNNRNKNNNKNKNNNTEAKDPLGANTGSGVQKKQSKSSGQYKMLG
ncbi:hypothetical protein AAFC00_001016 [Neodothiora populina]|uniref:RRM domain-containing protein n=1 Tax=Neodothiora populina TaxID=2781224 RepID=A0ABR3PMT7_9PEZI